MKECIAVKYRVEGEQKSQVCAGDDPFLHVASLVDVLMII